METDFEKRKKAIVTLKDEILQKVGRAQAIIMFGKTPKGEIRKRLMNPKLPKGPGNPEFSYLEHAFVSETLNLAFALDWDLVVTKSERVGMEALVEGYIEVRLKERTVRKAGFGGAVRIENNRNQTWGDVFKAATSDMLKNAAARLGIGLDLYRHEERAVEQADKTPVAPKDNGDPATPEQLATISGLIDKVLEKTPNYKVPSVDNLTKLEAGKIIAELASIK